MSYRASEVVEFIEAALECTIYVVPRDPGLTLDELCEVGKRLGFLPGEISDVLAVAAAPMYFGEAKLKPKADFAGLQSDFIFPVSPDYRRPEAFELVISEFRKLAREVGGQAARIDRSVLVARGASQGIAANDVEVAITMLIRSNRLYVADDGVLGLVGGAAGYPLPSEQRASAQGIGRAVVNQSVIRKSAFDVVKDVVARRTDGRPSFAEPLDAFLSVLDSLEHARFRIWWMTIVAELRRTDPTMSPLSVCVLCAALVEGALTFVAAYARSLGLGLFGSKDFDRSPSTWKITDLIPGAAGGSDPILDDRTRQRALDLTVTRQRIHAGGLLALYPSGNIPDLRPEEARDAKNTTDAVVRRVIDWFSRHPVKGENKSAAR